MASGERSTSEGVGIIIKKTMPHVVTVRMELALSVSQLLTIYAKRILPYLRVKKFMLRAAKWDGCSTWRNRRQPANSAHANTYPSSCFR